MGKLILLMLAALVIPASAQKMEGGTWTTLLPPSEAEQVYQIVLAQWNLNSARLNATIAQWEARGLTKKRTGFLQLQGTDRGRFTTTVYFEGSPDGKTLPWHGRITIDGYLERDVSAGQPTFKVWFDKITSRLKPPQWTGRSSSSGGRMKD